MKQHSIPKRRRTFGEHLTPIQLFKEFILPEIKDKLYDFLWVDMFAGEGNLILPILELIPEEERVVFFQKHIFLFDVQETLIQKAIQNATKYGIPEKLARKNILQRDTLKDYPVFLLTSNFQVYHITNPPYLYLGYIVKQQETRKYLPYFQGENEGYQDLYQLGLINDLRYGLEKMIYIIPANFLFGFAVSNKIRQDLLQEYTITKAFIFEKAIFEHTGTNVVICFFNRKKKPSHEPQTFEGIKYSKQIVHKNYVLHSRNSYRAGNAFDDFVSNFTAKNPLKVTYYLTLAEVQQNKGDFSLEVIDANAFHGKAYERRTIQVNEQLYNRIISNNLFIRTVDTGSSQGRAGLYEIRQVFGVDGILVSKAKYRTHPIQLFFEPRLKVEELSHLKTYFNLLLEFFRRESDSEFLTTYKYSNSAYTRKFLGLTQARKLIQTYPYFDLNIQEQHSFQDLIIKTHNAKKLLTFLQEKAVGRNPSKVKET